MAERRKDAISKTQMADPSRTNDWFFYKETAKDKRQRGDLQSEKASRDLSTNYNVCSWLGSRFKQLPCQPFFFAFFETGSLSPRLEGSGMIIAH